MKKKTHHIKSLDKNRFEFCEEQQAYHLDCCDQHTPDTFGYKTIAENVDINDVIYFTRILDLKYPDRHKTFEIVKKEFIEFLTFDRN
jgi:hypothetical protein